MPGTVLDSRDIKKIDTPFCEKVTIYIVVLPVIYYSIKLHSNSPSVFDFHKSLQPSEFHTGFFHESKFWSTILNTGIFKSDYGKERYRETL